MNVGIVVAAGKSERMGGDVDKAFLSLGPRPVAAYSLIAFEDCPDIAEVVLVVRRERIESARSMAAMFGCFKVKTVVAGGAKRQQSVQNGLDAVPEGTSVVAVHDGARPCVTAALISATVQSALRYGSGVAAVKVTDTIKHVERGAVVDHNVDREKLWAVQTPQAFRLDLLKQAFQLVARKRATVTDEAAAVELTGKEVRLVPSSPYNVKITAVDDLRVAAALLKL
jgi:2-C-methyl-D-erythritol 4-phosphate cytidylyltransferase